MINQCRTIIASRGIVEQFIAASCAR